MGQPVSGEDEHATPLAPAEREGLIPSHITLRSELNEVEQSNILTGTSWAFSRKRDPFNEAFLRGLHRRMFDEVWRWAGEYRTTDRNFGVESWRIATEVQSVLSDVRYWMANKTYSSDEIAVRYHHSLVSVHPFANGNGRWSRLAADLAIVALGRPGFTWGRSRLHAPSDTRRAYIDALKAADNHDFAPLIAFVRS